MFFKDFILCDRKETYEDEAARAAAAAKEGTIRLCSAVQCYFLCLIYCDLILCWKCLSSYLLKCGVWTSRKQHNRAKQLVSTDDKSQVHRPPVIPKLETQKKAIHDIVRDLLHFHRYFSSIITFILLWY